MNPVILKAHFDGQVIRLDEDYPLPVAARLLVTVVPEDSDLEARRALAAHSLSRAYGDDEPDYPLDRVAEPRSR